MAQRAAGATPIERLRSHFEAAETTCPACGYDDRGGEWRSETDGRRIRYRRTCPSCGTVRRRTYSLR
jgi:ribosomal protein S27AE